MRFRLSHGAAIAGAAVLALFTATLPAVATTPRPHNGPKPTVVLVNGAWADSSSWAPVIERLRRDAYPVRAIADPLQGLTSDTAYVSSYLATIDGPKVLVGHSYGGAVITNAATSVPDVRSLVYIAGGGPAGGEAGGGRAAGATPARPRGD